MYSLLFLAIFSTVWIAAAGSILWIFISAVLLMWQFRESSQAFSRNTLWNPLNVILRPGMLTEKGKRIRGRMKYAAIVFLLSMAMAGLFGMVISYSSH